MDDSKFLSLPTDLHQYLSYAARQKEMAAGSVTELVQAMKRPHSLSESINRPLIRKSEGGGEEERIGALGRRNSENVAPNRRNSLGSARRSMQRISEVPEKKPRKPSRLSFMGYNFFF